VPRRERRLKRHILVIDDNLDILDLVEMILHAEGYQVSKAPGGFEGIESARRAAPDLILLDVNMPHLDGWQVLKILKMEEGTSKVPVAMFTVRTDLKDKMYSFQRGAFDYITKPFSYNELADRIGHIFQSLPA
jgi:DNA-binding response OmpR family regulator